MGRPGFIAAPRTVIPALVVIVVLLALASFAGGEISPERVTAALVAGALILLVFATFLVVARLRRSRSGGDGGEP